MSHGFHGAGSGPAPLIFHVVFSFAVGGLENGVVNLINRLPSRRWRHGVVALTEVSEEFKARVERRDTLFIELRKRPGHALRLYPRLYRLFRELRPSIVHSRNLAALETVVPAFLAGVPARVHGEHGRDVGDIDGSNRKYQLVRRAYAPFVTRFIALSRDLDAYLREKVGVPPRKVEQLYNGVDTDRFRPAANGRKRVIDCPYQDPRFWLVGTVGRLEPVKDQTNLARAFVRALRLNPGARDRMRLVIVGDGSIRPAVQDVLRDADALDLAWFAGERSDVPDVMRSLDCFALPSLGEGISNTILEAMASGLPVVATRVGGNAELVEDRLTGRLVPAADAEALAARILDYFADPTCARSHGRAGRERVEREFSLDRMVERYDRLYCGVLNRNHPAAEDAGSHSRSNRHGSEGV